MRGEEEREGGHEGVIYLVPSRCDIIDYHRCPEEAAHVHTEESQAGTGEPPVQTRRAHGSGCHVPTHAR